MCRIQRGKALQSETVLWATHKLRLGHKELWRNLGAKTVPSMAKSTVQGGRPTVNWALGGTVGTQQSEPSGSDSDAKIGLWQQRAILAPNRTRNET